MGDPVLGICVITSTLVTEPERDMEVHKRHRQSIAEGRWGAQRESTVNKKQTIKLWK